MKKENIFTPFVEALKEGLKPFKKIIEKECNLEENCQCEDCKDARQQVIIDRYVR